MKLICYSLFDNKALAYSPPFYAPSHGVATRMLSELVADANTAVGRHPADFTLYAVGDFDDQTAILSKRDPKEHVIDAISLVQHQPSLLDENSLYTDKVRESIGHDTRRLAKKGL